MSIADKLTLVAKNQEKVYKAGQNSMVDPEKLIPITKTGKVISLNDVSEIPHSVGVKTESNATVTVCKKNIVDVGLSADLERNADVVKIENGFKITNKIAAQVNIYIPCKCILGENYTAFAVWTFELAPRIMYTNKTTQVILSNGVSTSFVATENEFYFRITLGANESGTINFAQVEKGTLSTDYEPFESTVYNADSDGIVEDIKSLSPYMNICTSSDADITVQYYKSYGAQTEYDRFWDEFQAKGTRSQYPYAFWGNWWNDDIYKPKYDIIINSGTAVFQDSKITDTKVAVDLSTLSGNANTIFSRCTRLKNIRKLIVNEALGYTSVFDKCESLADIKIEGTIGKSISFAQSPLNIESLKNIILHLKDYSGGSTETHILTLKDGCKTLLEENGNTSPNGNLWTEYVSDLGWTLA